MELLKEILLTYEKHRFREDSGMYDEQWFAQRSERFENRFGSEQLSGLDGDRLLETLFDRGNRDSLLYWLEFKNDDEFTTNAFGVIGRESTPGSAVIRRKEDGQWAKGEGQQERILEPSEAVDSARIIRDSLVRGAELIRSMPADLEDTAYFQLQDDLEGALGDLVQVGWVHKYFHLLFPEKIDNLHSMEAQTFYLIKLLQHPVRRDARYAVACKLLRFARQVDLRINNFTRALRMHFGPPHKYWRVGTTDGATQRSYWKEMKQNGYISVGWQALGDARRFDTLADLEARSLIRNIISRNYPNNATTVTKSARQYFNFYRQITPGDIVVACRGKKVMGIGRVIGRYEFNKDLGFPHFRRVQWLVHGGEDLPKPGEGLLTTINVYEDADNLLEIERRIKDFRTESSLDGGLAPTVARIRDVLERKRQVILYGPPGTGKTYWAEKVASELASRRAFNKPFSKLRGDERVIVWGDGKKRGLARFCCFHPSYGYEDFVVGIRARVETDRTVFEVTDGVFKTACADAAANPRLDYFFIIDEINRGDISRIFGELITLLEGDKRGKNVILPISGESFSIPSNLYIIGTMNTADRSIALLDVALRRRFGFFELMPDYSLFEGVVIRGLPLGLWLEALNKRIVENVGRDARNLQIGHSYFMRSGVPIRDVDTLRKVLREDVIPLLEEYCYGDYGAIAKIIGEGFVDQENQTIRDEFLEPGNEDELINGLLKPNPGIEVTSTIDTGDEAYEENEAEVDQEQ